MPEIVTTSEAFCPPVHIPISQAIKANGFIFLMGVGPRDAVTSALVGTDIETQTRQVILNAQAILKAAGAELKDIVRATCFLTADEQYDGFNSVFNDYFADIRPARTTIIITGFRAPGMLMEMEITAIDPAASK